MWRLYWSEIHKKNTPSLNYEDNNSNLSQNTSTIYILIPFQSIMGRDGIPWPFIKNNLLVNKNNKAWWKGGQVRIHLGQFHIFRTFGQWRQNIYT